MPGSRNSSHLAHDLLMTEGLLCIEGVHKFCYFIGQGKEHDHLISMGGKLAHHLEMVEMCNPIVRWEENNCKKKKNQRISCRHIFLCLLFIFKELLLYQHIGTGRNRTAFNLSAVREDSKFLADSRRNLISWKDISMAFA